MRIAVSMRVVDAVGYSEPRDAISHDWTRRLFALQLTPVLIPNAAPDPAAYLESMAVEGLLLTGGNDLDPGRFGGPQPGAARDVSQVRDEAEFAMLRYAVERRLPVLGSCRGMQTLNAFFGGSLVSEKLDEGVHLGRRHPVDICDGRVARLVGVRRLEVNSYHRWGVFEDDLSPQLRAFARVPFDGSVEGIYHPDLPVVGIMWHPERAGAPESADEHLCAALWSDRGDVQVPWGRGRV